MMIDHAKHFDSVVKDELAKACVTRGIDKSEAGYAIGGFGETGLLFLNDGSATPGPRWTVMVSLRPLLLGVNMHRVAASVPVTGVCPPDEAFRQAVQFLTGQADEGRKAELNGKPSGGGNGKINPFEVRKL